VADEETDEEVEEEEARGGEGELIPDPPELEVAVIPDETPPVIADSVENFFDDRFDINGERGRTVGIIIRNTIVATLALGGFAGFSHYYLMRKIISGNSMDSW
jgi:hypothetical protein